MDRTERFYRIQQLLTTRRGVTTQEFLDELEVSRATFKRDLEYLRDRFNAPILYDHELEAYRFDDRVEDRATWQLPGLWFSADELRALLTMDHLLDELAPGVLGEAVGPLRRRLRALLDAGSHHAEEIAGRVRVLTMGARHVEPAHFRVITGALLARRRLAIRHVRREDGVRVDREVSPQRLVHYRDNWYLDAWCHERNALRTFAVDAIERATVVERPAKDVPDATLDRHYTSGYGIFSGADTETAVLEFNARRARWVSRETWHPKQEGIPQPDGTYVLRLPYARAPELVMDILKYGADVKVLAPPDLARAVADAHAAAAALYR
ncbi:MAG: WYL domain-containing protein [Steroidobacteraceae bacterium]